VRSLFRGGREETRHHSHLLILKEPQNSDRKPSGFSKVKLASEEGATKTSDETSVDGSPNCRGQGEDKEAEAGRVCQTFRLTAARGFSFDWEPFAVGVSDIKTRERIAG